MKRHKLPFNISLDKKYNELNIEDFPFDWEEYKIKRKPRTITMENELHMELSKFKTYNIGLSEIIDLGMRYALGKQEFRKLAAELIEIKIKE